MQNYIYGAGGHGKVVLDAMQTEASACHAFVDDKDISKWMGLDVIVLGAINLETARLHLAVGDNAARMKLADNLACAGFFTVKHSKAVIAVSASIGDGCLVAANAIVGPSSQVGDHCIINHAAVIDHDCRVAKFSHIAPNATLGGGVVVGESVLIGAGATILPGIEVGANAIVGAGAVVTKDVAAGASVVGIPAKLVV